LEKSSDPVKLKKPWNFEEPLCAEVGVEVFYLEERDAAGTLTIYEYNQAKKICSSCVHKEECLEWAIYNENYGIWGGTTPTERYEIRKKRKILLR
jgi:hypothetical protein